MTVCPEATSFPLVSLAVADRLAACKYCQAVHHTFFTHNVLNLYSLLILTTSTKYKATPCGPTLQTAHIFEIGRIGLFEVVELVF